MILEEILICSLVGLTTTLVFKKLEIFTFYMFKYKSSWCPNKKDSHDSKSCIYAHNMRDFRRPPEIFNYSPENC
jgi:hypothetical protein